MRDIDFNYAEMAKIVSNHKDDINYILEKCSEYLDSADFEKAYNCCLDDRSLLTAALILSGVNPLSNMSYVPNHAFQNLPITGIVIPDNIKVLGYGCFSACDKLTTLIIPKSVERIDKFVFYSTHIKKIDYESTAEDFKKITLKNGWDANSNIESIGCSNGIIVNSF